VLNVYVPKRTQKFKKTSPGRPDYHLLVFDSETEEVPSPLVLQSFASLESEGPEELEGIPILLCVWASGNPFFLSLSLPPNVPVGTMPKGALG
jgi:hypothetical protein